MPSEAQLERNARDRLEAATEWLIPSGIEFLSEGTAGDLKGHLIDEYKVNLWVTPAANDERFHALFMIKSRGIHFDIQALFRTVDEGEIFEFWMVRVSSLEWAGDAHHCRFFFTRADSEEARRTILLRSDEFIPSAVTASGTVLRFPLDDMRVLYDMQAWNYRSYFEGTGVPTREVSVNSNGEYFFIE